MEEDTNGSVLMLPDSSLKRGWRKGKDGETTDADDTSCGIGSCRPVALQCCASMAAFTGVYSFSALLTTALQTYIASQVTTLERHFGFSSSVSGFLLSCNDIGFLSVTIGVSYLVRKIHIPRLLALTTVLYGASGFICVIPFFITRDRLVPPKNATFTPVFQSGPLCRADADVITVTEPSLVSGQNTSEQRDCGAQFSYVTDDATRKMAVAIIAAGMILQGVCKAPRSSALTTYVDDNVVKTKTAMYMGVMTGVAICATAIAFGVGGVFSRLFITLQGTSMTPLHPRWLGAWWLGFMVFGGLAVVTGLPLLLFPRTMQLKGEQTTGDRNALARNLGFVELLKALARLFSNPVFFPIIIGNCITFFTMAGFMAFLPKYMETQFSMPAWKSNVLLGGASIVSNCAGTIIGGVLTSKLKLSSLMCLKVATGFWTFSLILQFMFVFFGCSNPVISKGEIPVARNMSISLPLPLQPASTTPGPASCLSACGCTDYTYFPMCGADGKNYFSPCHAGCSSFNITNNNLYDNCACVSGNEQSATPGLCTPDCPFFYVFMALSVVGSFILMIAAMPVFIAIIRSVEEKDKPLSLGVGGFLYTVLGFLPGPIFMGWLIDGVCLHWSSGCSGKGACVLYDIEQFRYRMMGLGVVTRIITCLLYVFALCMALRPGSLFMKKQEGTEEEKIKMNRR